MNRAAFDKLFNEIPRGGQVLLDAHNTDYIDPDILSLIREFKERTAPIRGIHVSLRGFRDKYQLRNEIQFVDYSTRGLQGQLTAEQVLQILKDGNERFRTGQRLTRDFGQQILGSASGQFPLAVVLSCIDSRSPAELIFDLGLGDIFSVRIAGNVTSQKVLGSLEYGCAVAGAKLIVVVGHTQCGAVTAAVDLACSGANAEQVTGCQHLEPIIDEIQQAIEPYSCQHSNDLSATEKAVLINTVARRNVSCTVQRILQDSHTISQLVHNGRIAVIGAMYDVVTGQIDFFPTEVAGSLPAAAAS